MVHAGRPRTARSSAAVRVARSSRSVGWITERRCTWSRSDRTVSGSRPTGSGSTAVRIPAGRRWTTRHPDALVGAPFRLGSASARAGSVSPDLGHGHLLGLGLSRSWSCKGVTGSRPRPSAPSTPGIRQRHTDAALWKGDRPPCRVAARCGPSGRVGRGRWRARIAPARRGRPPRQPRPRPHPFALDADGIRLAVTELGGSQLGSPIGVDETELVLRLPDDGGGPPASPWLDDTPTHPPSMTLPRHPGRSPHGPSRAWSSNGREARPVLSTLVAVAGDPLGLPTSDPSGIAVAADLRFAARAVEMALELITRGRVLPTLEPTADGWRARWRPLIDGLDRGRIEALRWSLPASWLPRRRGQDPRDGVPERRRPTRPSALLMWGFTDALVRRLRRPIDIRQTDPPADDAGRGTGVRSTPGWPPWPPPMERSRMDDDGWPAWPEGSGLAGDGDHAGRTCADLLPDRPPCRRPADELQERGHGDQGPTGRAAADKAAVRRWTSGGSSSPCRPSTIRACSSPRPRVWERRTRAHRPGAPRGPPRRAPPPRPRPRRSARALARSGSGRSGAVARRSPTPPAPSPSSATAPRSWNRRDSGCWRHRGGARRGPGSASGSRPDRSKSAGHRPAPSGSTASATSDGRRCSATTSSAWPSYVNWPA